MSFQLREMSIRDLANVLSWRNQPEVRKYMYTQHEISLPEHEKWFEKVKNDHSKRYLIAVDGEKDVGLINFTEIDEKNGTAYWGFYSADLTLKGVGRRMEITALKYAFENLKLRKLNCEVLSSNPKVILLHRRNGFKIEGIFKEQFTTPQGELLDIYRLALTQKDWFKINDESAIHYAPGTLKEYSFSINEDMIQHYALATGDFNPIHFDDVAARASRFPGKVAHGMLLTGLISKVFGTQFPGVGTIYLNQTLNFKKPCLVNSTINLKLEILNTIGRRITLQTNFYDDKNELLADGEALILSPLE